MGRVPGLEFPTGGSLRQTQGASLGCSLTAAFMCSATLRCKWSGPRLQLHVCVLKLQRSALQGSCRGCTGKQTVPDGSDDAGVDGGSAEVRRRGVEDGRDAGHAVVPAVLVHRPFEALHANAGFRLGLETRSVSSFRIRVRIGSGVRLGF